MFEKEATSICKTILRNGYDAYIINASLQSEIYNLTQEAEIEIACEADFETLGKLFNTIELSHFEGVIAQLKTETGLVCHFYPITSGECSHPEFGLWRVSPHMLDVLNKRNLNLYNAIKGVLGENSPEGVFEDRSSGYIRLKGVPFRTLQKNYGLAFTALRMAANYDLPVEPATWLAILKSSHQISDYIPASLVVQEMRLVAAENLWKFVQLLADSHILHTILPEVAALQALKQQKNKNDPTEITVFQHTIDSMRYYPEENLHHDWIGVIAVLFHNVGKLYTAEFFNEKWTFYQYHKIGAQITRKILRRFNFPIEDIDTICNLIRNHLRFHSMLTDRGIRRFQALPDTQRIIEMARANIKATNSSYTNFNHNLKYLERALTPERMLEPLLNGNEIMEFTHLPPGKAIGIIREALLQAQIEGKVTDLNSAIAFVREYKLSETE